MRIRRKKIPLIRVNTAIILTYNCNVRALSTYNFIIIDNRGKYTCIELE